MTFAPATILQVRAYLKAQDPDLSDTELGIVGGPSHITQGTSYHLGADQLIMSKNPYSVRTARDKAGLSNAASALDIDDDLDELRALSIWCVQQCRLGMPDTLDIREIIYSPTGASVFRWDRERGLASLPIPDSDLSHLTHTHISWYRDSEFRDKTAIFRRFFEVPQMNMFIQVAGDSRIYISDSVTYRHMPSSAAWSAAQAAGARLIVVASEADLKALGGTLATGAPPGTVDMAAIRAIVREELDDTKLGPQA